MLHIKKKTIYACFSNLTYEWLISSSSDSELVKIEMDDCVIEYVSAKVPFCQIDKLTIYDGKYKFIRINYRLRLVYGV